MKKRRLRREIKEIIKITYHMMQLLQKFIICVSLLKLPLTSSFL